MKKIKIFLDISALILISVLLFVFSFKEDEEIIPESSDVLIIEDWDKSESKESILKNLQLQAEKENIQIIKVISDLDIRKKRKDVFVFNSKLNNKTTFDIDHEKANIIEFNSLVSKEIKGKYFIIGDDFDKNIIINELNKTGVTANIETINRIELFINLLFENNMLIPIFSMLILYFLYYLFDRSNQFKNYAIQKIHGFSNRQIMFFNYKRPIAYWSIILILFLILNWSVIFTSNWIDNDMIFFFRLVILICVFLLILFILWLISYLLLLIIDIKLMVKGKNTHRVLIFIGGMSKYLMLLILSGLIVQNVSTYEKMSNIYNSENIWSKLEDYYFLEYSPKMSSENETRELEQKTYNLVKKEEKHGAMLLKNNNMNKPDKNNYIPENGNVFFVNENFIKFYSLINNNFKEIHDKKGEIDIFLPPRYNQEKHIIRENYHEWINYQKEKRNQKHLTNIEILPKDFKVFSFDRLTHLEYTDLDSPVIVVLNSEDLSGKFYLSAVSQNGYIFKGFEEIKTAIKENNLENDISGITNYKDSVLSELKKVKIQMSIIIATLISNIIVLIMATIFEVTQYFEGYKKQLLLKKLHGFSILRSNVAYFLSTLFINFIMIFVGYILFSSKLLNFILLILMFIQILIQGIYIRHLERNFKELIKVI